MTDTTVMHENVSNSCIRHSLYIESGSLIPVWTIGAYISFLYDFVTRNIM